MRRNRTKKLGKMTRRKRTLEDVAQETLERSPVIASLISSKRVRVRSSGRTGRTDGTMIAGYVMVFLDPLSPGYDAPRHAMGYYPREIEYLDESAEEVSQ